MKRILIPVLLMALLVAIGCRGQKRSDNKGFYTLNIETTKDLKEFFAYSPDRIPFVSAK